MQTTAALQDTGLPIREASTTRSILMVMLGAAAMGACIGIRGGADAATIRMIADPDDRRSG